MKKSDLTRRANRAAVAYSNIYDQPRDTFVKGFESGYRAARVDLRRLIVKNEFHLVSGHQIIEDLKNWLRPIR